jgi:hypothetical protein
MLRTSLNMDYYHDLYDLATDFGVEVEAHRMLSPLSVIHLTDIRHRDWSWCIRDRTGVY